MLLRFRRVLVLAALGIPATIAACSGGAMIPPGEVGGAGGAGGAFVTTGSFVDTTSTTGGETTVTTGGAVSTLAGAGACTDPDGGTGMQAMPETIPVPSTFGVPSALVAAAGSIFVGQTSGEDVAILQTFRIDACGTVVDIGSSLGLSPYAMAANADDVFVGFERFPLAGGPVTTMGPQKVAPVAVAVDATAYFWLDVDLLAMDGRRSSLWRIALSGGGPIKLAQGQIEPQAITVTGGYVYIANAGTYQAGTMDSPLWNGDGSVVRVPVFGGPAEKIATNLAAPSGMVATADRVIVGTTGDGAIRAMNLDGSGVTTLATGEINPTGLAVSGDTLYWTDAATDGAVKKVPIAGGAVTTIAAGELHPRGIVVSGGYVYWTSGVGVRRAPQ